MRAMRSQYLTCSVVAVALASALAACGSSSGSSSAAASASAGGASAKADVATAQAFIRPYVDQPSAFPVDKPLTRRLPAGSRFAYLQCVTPICGLFAELLPPAIKAIGGNLQVVRAGASATSLQSSMTSIIQQKPAALLLPAVEPDSINTQLRQAAQAGIKIASNGIMNARKYAIGGGMFDVSTATLAGRLMAAWAISQKGGKANVVFYSTPELSFSAYMQAGFASEMKQLCSSCTVRYVQIPVATIGNTAPSRVVSDLQANPKTNITVFATNEAATGLPAAMKAASITGVETMGFGPSPANLQDIKSGAQTAGLGLDFATMTWAQVDEAARQILHEPLTAGEKSGIPVLQFLTKQKLAGDNPSQGWTGYPDFPQRFSKLWSGHA
jgi:ribose transport system substrate-binding protein